MRFVIVSHESSFCKSKEFVSMITHSGSAIINISVNNNIQLLYITITTELVLIQTWDNYIWRRAYLRFGVGPGPRECPTSSQFCDLFVEPVRQDHCQRHALFSLIRSIAEHQTLEFIKMSNTFFAVNQTYPEHRYLFKNLHRVRTMFKRHSLLKHFSKPVIRVLEVRNINSPFFYAPVNAVL